MLRMVYNKLMNSLEDKDPMNELPVKTKVKLFLSQWSVWLTLFVVPLSAIVAFGIYTLTRLIGGSL